jgi:hypothetical protein
VEVTGAINRAHPAYAHHVLNVITIDQDGTGLQLVRWSSWYQRIWQGMSRAVIIQSSSSAGLTKGYYSHHYNKVKTVQSAIEP